MGLVTHSIVATNTRGPEATRSDVVGNITVLYALLGVNTDATISSHAMETGGSRIGTAASPIDPRLGPLASNGGPTKTHTPLPGSPAINAGNPAATNGAAGVPLVDQRGGSFIRVAGGRVDIGAVEAQSSADFNDDALVDGFDFLAWQRGFGAAAPAGAHATGDSDFDQDVDSEDLAAWHASFESVAASVASSSALTERAASAPPSPAVIDAVFAMEQMLANSTSRRAYRPRVLRAR